MGHYYRAGLGQDAPPSSSPEQTKMAETTQMLNDVGPLIKSLGPIAAMFGPLIMGAIEASGPGAVTVVNSLPLPPRFKTDFANMVKNSKKKVAQSSPPPMPQVQSSGMMTSTPVIIAVVAGVGVLGLAVLASLKKG